MKKILVFMLTITLFMACKEQTTDTSTPKTIKRYASITGLKPEKMAYYKELHAKAWAGVLKKIKESHIQNYSIYLKEIDGKPYLFSYFEYVGNDFQKDMQGMATDTLTQRWWRETDPCQQPLPDAAAKGQIWSDAEEVFHAD